MSKKSIRIQLENQKETDLKLRLEIEAKKAGFPFLKRYMFHLFENRHQIKTKEMDKARGEG